MTTISKGMHSLFSNLESETFWITIADSNGLLKVDYIANPNLFSCMYLWCGKGDDKSCHFLCAKMASHTTRKTSMAKSTWSSITYELSTGIYYRPCPFRKTANFSINSNLFIGLL